MPDNVNAGATAQDMAASDAAARRAGLTPDRRPDANTQATTGTSATGTNEQAQPSEAYKGLQRELNKARDDLKAKNELINQLKGQPSADEELTQLREERSQLQRELEVTKLKAGNPDIADIIDLFASRTNQVPDEEALGLFRDRLGKRSPEAPTIPASSGLRNSSTRQVETEEGKARRVLENAALWD